MSLSLIFGIFQIIVLIYSVVLHELAHGLVARSMGDRTAERMGRLTLNPFSHLELFGSFILPLLSYQLGGFVFGYAKPVPYDPDALSDRRYGAAKVAVAGPLVNLGLALLFGAFVRLWGDAVSPILLDLMNITVATNIVLALFNLIPIPPLDGHWLLLTFLPTRYYALRSALYRYQWLLLVFVIFFLFPMLVPVMRGLGILLTGHILF